MIFYLHDILTFTVLLFGKRNKCLHVCCHCLICTALATNIAWCFRLNKVIIIIILERQLNNGNLPAAQINYVIIQTLSKNQHFTDLCAVNKQLTRIISNGSLIIRLCDTCEYTETANHPCAVGVSKRSKVALLRVIKECTAWTHPFSSSSFLFWSTRFVGPRFD